MFGDPRRAVLALAVVAGCSSPGTPTSGPVPAKPVSTEPAQVPESGSFSVLTYNVHGLYPAITGDDTPARMALISPLLNAFDVNALQENFFFSDLLMADVGLPFVHHSDKPLPNRSTHSGLTIAAGMPIDAAEGVPWETCWGFLSGASDCLASKGFQFARLRLGEGPHAAVDLYNLHMEAGGSDGDNEARTAQVEQLLAYVSAHSAGRPVIVLGDTNLRPSDPLDSANLQRLATGAGLVDACEAVGCPETNHIDRFLLRSGDDVELEVTSWKREPSFVDADGADLSDHPALSARFSWSTHAARDNR